MPAETTQISVFISDATSSELDHYIEARGLKKGYVVEQALRFHLRALKELPVEVIVPPQLVVSADTAERLLRLGLEHPDQGGGVQLAARQLAPLGEALGSVEHVVGDRD